MNSRRVFQKHQHFSTRSDWEMRNCRYLVQKNLICLVESCSLLIALFYMNVFTCVIFLHTLGTDGSFLPDHIWHCRSEDDLSTVPFSR